MKKELVSVSLLLTFVLSIVSAHGLVVGSNVDITSGNDTNNRQQAEPTIAVDPRNTNIIVAGAQDLRLLPQGGHRWHGYYRSTDGGQTWSVSLLPGFPGDNSPEGTSSPLRRFDFVSDPVLAFDRNGNVYYTGIAANLDRFGNVKFSSVRAFVAKYTSDGAIYAGVTMIQGIGADKPWIAVDTTGGSRDGSIYLAFDLSNVVFTRSTDGGATFSKPKAVTKSGSALPGVAVDAAGNVYVSSLDRFVRSTGSSTHVQVSTSTDGGLTFSTVAAATISQIPSPLPFNSFRTFTIPQIAADGSGVYVVWDGFRTGDADVLFTRSTDNGATWTLPLRVNDVAVNQQFFPSVAASGGTINVAWYDSRLDDGGTIESLDVFYAQSTNAGVSFSTNLRVTSVSFDPNLVLRTDPPGSSSRFMGDYIQVAAAPTAAHVIWVDNRNACGNLDPTLGCLDQDVFTATITP